MLGHLEHPPNTSQNLVLAKGVDLKLLAFRPQYILARIHVPKTTIPSVFNSVTFSQWHVILAFCVGNDKELLFKVNVFTFYVQIEK